jgi:NADH dehydrogenase
MRIRREILLAFEHADRESDPQRRALLLSFAIIGAGPTGVELAGALAEIAHHTLRRDFRHIDPAEAHIHLIDALPRVLAAYPPDLSVKALRSLGQLGIEVITGATVCEIKPGEVTLKTGDQTRSIRAGTVLWAAGVAASPLGGVVAAASGAATDGAGRVLVEPDFSLPGRPEVFIVGDLATRAHGSSAPLPGIAPVAMQAGEHVARCITARVAARPAPPPFRYRNRGSLATIGRAAAVGVVGRWHVSGFVAWLLWLLVHVRYLARAENRLLVLIQWAWSYFTYNRSARLITEAPRPQFPPS